MKKHYFIVILLTGLLAVIIFAGCKSSGPSKENVFRFNLEEGKTYSYETNWDFEQQVDTEVSKTSMLVHYLFHVSDVDDDIKTIRFEYNRAVLHFDIMETKIDVDTDIPFVDSVRDYIDMDKMAKMMFSGIKGKSFIIKVNDEGKVVAVSGFDKVRQALTNPIDHLPGELGHIATENFAKSLTEENVRRQFERMFFVFPGKEIKTGDSWERDYDYGGDSSIKLKHIYTVSSIAGNLVTLDMKTDMIPGSSEPIKHSMTGNFLIDYKTGLILNSAMEQAVERHIGNMLVKTNTKVKIKGTIK